MEWITDNNETEAEFSIQDFRLRIKREQEYEADATQLSNNR